MTFHNKIKLYFLRKQNAILTFIVLILGIMPSSCKKYGTESQTYFFLKGKIKASNTNQPIDQISISNNQNTVKSNSTGDYSIYYQGYGDQKTFSFSFKDIDSNQNGSFKDKDTTLTFDHVPNLDLDGPKIMDILLDPK